MFLNTDDIGKFYFRRFLWCSTTYLKCVKAQRKIYFIAKVLSFLSYAFNLLYKTIVIIYNL